MLRLQTWTRWGKSTLHVCQAALITAQSSNKNIPRGFFGHEIGHAIMFKFLYASYGNLRKAGFLFRSASEAAAYRWQADFYKSVGLEDLSKHVKGISELRRGNPKDKIYITEDILMKFYKSIKDNLQFKK
jgi:hypothetical protein